jgi:hypothetical protein
MTAVIKKNVPQVTQSIVDYHDSTHKGQVQVLES